jgi:hypothetical protein
MSLLGERVFERSHFRFWPIASLGCDAALSSAIDECEQFWREVHRLDHEDPGIGGVAERRSS